MREIRRRNIRSALVVWLALAVLAVVIGILVDPGLFGRAISHKDWFVHVAPETLVEYSEHIVVARYQDEGVHETPQLLVVSGRSHILHRRVPPVRGGRIPEGRLRAWRYHLRRVGRWIHHRQQRDREA